MHVGMASVFQNPQKTQTDREVYRNELRLADLAEPLGFESIWGVEHHFTDYTMCPDVLQFLTYMAGRTERAQLGSMVVVLPWHDPMRVAEEIAMLDNISDGRLILGLGRGAGKVEFDGFRLSMDESRAALRRVRRDDPGRARDRLLRVRRHVRQAAARGHPAGAVQVVPRPHLRRGGVARVAADHGEARRRHPDHPAEAVARGGEGARDVPRRSTARSTGSTRRRRSRPGWTFCDARRRARARAWRAATSAATTRRCSTTTSSQGDHLATTKGYEYYGKMSDKIAHVRHRHGHRLLRRTCRSGARPSSATTRSSTSTGAPATATTSASSATPGMPYDEAERNMRLFAAEVMPALQKLEVTRGGTAGAGGRRYARRSPRAGLLTWRSRRSSTRSPTAWPRSRSTGRTA